MVSITDAEFEKIVNFVYRTYGIDLRKKRQLIEGRLSQTLKTKGVAGFEQYFNMLLNDKSGTEMNLFLNKITTNHSYFGRENEHFDFLQNVALPDLEKRRQKELRIWSAGCSAGQEAYNIAMTIDQYFGPRKSQWDTRILATDISTAVLEKAKKGAYAPDNLTDLPPVWRSKYFKMQPDGTYQISEQMRNEVIFKVFNLMDEIVYKKPFDIIFCRNVMIYFDAETTTKLVKRFYDATAEGGYLFIGHSESIDKERTGYTYVRPSTYQKITKK
ncbi:MAG: protein-glutamate O-methyltransferase CheR [Clostridia bacterium]|nr:protein-glutamate O-methyltransferase CheR [Clostridia bacterium]